MMTEQTVRMQASVNGIDIDYEVRGRGRPILLIHGWSADRHYMVADLEPVFEEHPGWQRIYLDLPGHGRTPAPPWLSTQAQMVEIVQRFIEAVVPEGMLAVAGSSYGGYLTLALVRTIPHRLLGVGLLIPDVPSSDGSRDTTAVATIHPDDSIFADLEPGEEWIPSALVTHERRMLEAIRAEDLPAYRLADYDFLGRLERNYLLTGLAGVPGLPFPGPSVILTGRQDATVGYRSAFSLLDEFPRATYAVADLAGHHLGRVERPEVFRCLVDDWLERLALQRGALAPPP
jgi:pimeloyl-ACP methyl ester carboxylesterase